MWESTPTSLGAVNTGFFDSCHGPIAACRQGVAGAIGVVIAPPDATLRTPSLVKTLLVAALMLPV
jgi:hypothetical protein